MKDFDEQYDSVWQTSKSRNNRMNTPTFTIISCKLTLPTLITTTLAHLYQAQTVAGVSVNLSAVKMNMNVITKIF
jgi:hypothetical protein